MFASVSFLGPSVPFRKIYLPLSSILESVICRGNSLAIKIVIPLVWVGGVKHCLESLTVQGRNGSGPKVGADNVHSAESSSGAGDKTELIGLAQARRLVTSKGEDVRAWGTAGKGGGGEGGRQKKKKK